MRAAHLHCRCGQPAPVLVMDLSHETVHSSEEDPCDIERAELAEAYGTPPTRLNAIKPLRKLASKTYIACFHKQ